MEDGLSRPVRKGLTLIEVGVIAALVSVLGMLLAQIPRLPDMWREYRAAGCLSHLRQLTAATRLYLADNDDMFPYAGRDAPFANNVDVWAGLSPYVDSADVFLCPQDPSPAWNIRWCARNGKGKIQAKDLTIPSSYGYFLPFFHPFDCASGKNVARPARSMPLSGVVDPARKALFNCYASEWASGPGNPGRHHPEGWALGMVDGRARLVPYSKLNRA